MIERWTNSALMKLERCGEAFRRRYLEGEAVPPNARMLRGTVVHSVARITMQRKLAKAAPVTLAEAADTAADEFEKEWAGGVKLDGDDAPADSIAAEKGRSKDFAIDLSTFYVAQAAPKIDPIAVERLIVVKPRDSDLEIAGGIDLIARTEDGGEAIHDTKTSEKSPAKDAADRSQQLTMYAMIRAAEVGALPSRLTLDYVVRTPALAQRKHIPLHTTRDAEDVRSLVNRLNTAVEAVKRGVFVPAAPDSWWCSPSWCEYYATCVYVRRGDRPRA